MRAVSGLARSRRSSSRVLARARVAVVLGTTRQFHDGAFRISSGREWGQITGKAGFPALEIKTLLAGLGGFA